MKLKTNEKRLVKIAVEGKAAPALAYPNEIGNDGRIHNIPSVGGITFNVLVGDPAFGWAADHIEPCVSTIHNSEKRKERPNVAFNFLTCIGNEAVIIGGKMAGKKGIVTGHHGGVEHVIIDFPKDVFEKMSLDDKIQIRTFGQGLALEDFPEVILSSLDPELLNKMSPKACGKKLEVEVSKIVPSKLTGSGMGSTHSKSGDIDLISSDKKLLEQNDLLDLKLGDIVAIADCDASFGWCHRGGAVTVAVVIHGDSHLSGHGPGMATIMTSSTGAIVPKKSKDANIGRYLKIGRYRKIK